MTLRTFTGLAVPPGIARQISRLQDACPVGRPVAEENLHLTLTFHGDQPLDVLEELDAILADLKIPEIDITLNGLDLFGAKERGGLTIAVEKSVALVALYSDIGRACRSAGIALERRRFQPHITFARFNRPPDPIRLQPFLDSHGRFGPLSFVARELVLYRSTLKRTGAEYDALSTYPTHDT